MITRESDAVRRHRNPVGIAARVVIYPGMAVAAWRHRRVLLVAGALSEVLLWTAVPPVEQTVGFIDEVVDQELAWLNAPAGRLKTVSFAVLGLFPVLLFTGLWRHSRRLLAVSAGLAVLFHALMRRLAASDAPVRRGG